MKKIKFIINVAIAAVFLMFSGSKAFAIDPYCGWETTNNSATYCVGGFESEDEGQDYEIKVTCEDNCGWWIELNHSIISLRDKSFTGSSNNYQTCLTSEKDELSSSLQNQITACLNDGNTIEDCMPVIKWETRKNGFLGFGAEWCSAIIPDNVLSPYVGGGAPTLPTPTPAPEGAIGGPVTNETLNALNPLLIAGTSENAKELSTPGGIISRLLDFVFPIAGLILFVMLVTGGFGMVAGATNKKALETSQQRMTSAIVGFILLFSSFWIMRLIEMIFSLKIL